MSALKKTLKGLGILICIPLGLFVAVRVGFFVLGTLSYMSEPSPDLWTISGRVIASLRACGEPLSERILRHVERNSNETQGQVAHNQIAQLLLSITKLEISLQGQAGSAAPQGARRKRSLEGIPVPVMGRK
jgi:hypothetical protein